MKKIFFLLAASVLAFSCTKESDTPAEPEIVRDQVLVEERLIGSWKGRLEASIAAHGAIDLQVEIENMALNEQSTSGNYLTPDRVCPSEWVYHQFSMGIASFKEQSFNSQGCSYKNATIEARFEDKDFNTLHVNLLNLKGTLTRQ